MLAVQYLVGIVFVILMHSITFLCPQIKNYNGAALTQSICFYPCDQKNRHYYFIWRHDPSNFLKLKLTITVWCHRISAYTARTTTNLACICTSATFPSPLEYKTQFWLEWVKYSSTRTFLVKGERLIRYLKRSQSFY